MASWRRYHTSHSANEACKRSCRLEKPGKGSTNSQEGEI